LKCGGAFVVALACALPASARQTIGCTTGGPGGPFPTSGTGDGIYPNTFPTFPLVSNLAVTIPAGATVVTSVTFRNMSHTFVGDCQFVLTDPAGARYNIFCRPPFGCDFSGDYTIVGSCGGGMGMPSTCPTIFPAGTYDEYFGTWPSGTNSITNTPMFSIPAQSGTWTLTIYDWAGADVGTLTSWEMCFGTPPPLPPPGAPTQTSPPSGSILSVPVTLQWAATACATGYDVDVDGTVTSVVTTSYATSPAAGTHNWRVRGTNGAGPGAWSTTWTFDVPPPPPPSQCVPGGGGGLIPTSGSGDGTWPTTMPTAPLNVTLSVSIPPGATKIVRVKLNSFFHTYIGDTHIVLEDPTGMKFTVLHRPWFTGACCGSGCDWSGDYSIYETAGFPVPNCTGTVAPGDYNQDFGTGGGMWPSGTNGILDVALGAIAIMPGTWTLHIYDWAAIDTGSLASWELCFDVPSGPTPYCTAGTSTNGCVPAISATAQPSISFSNSCVITAANVEGQKSGLVFYGLTKLNPAVQWGIGSNSFLCVKAPTQRMPTQSSGGTLGLCNGALVQNWNTYQMANPASLGNPFSAGTSVFVQGWYRDPAAIKTTNLTNALEMTMAP
jgi:subtilisin-like proprotein convertase family protein